MEKFLNRSGMDVVSYRSGDSFLADWESVRSQSGCMLIDLHLSGETGFSLLDELERRDCELPFVMISGRGVIPDATTAMRRGAIDFLEKPFDPELLVDRLNEGIRRDAARWEKKSSERLFTMRLNSLTERERQVMTLVVEGKSTKVIANELGIAPKTVEVHRTKLLRKMQVATTIELVRMASASGAV